MTMFNDNETPDSLEETLAKSLRQQAITIAQLAEDLVTSVSETMVQPENEESDEARQQYAIGTVCGDLLKSAWQLGGKLAAACTTTEFGFRLEMAVLIKRSACDLQAQTSHLASLAPLPGQGENDLQDAVKVFQTLFVPWVAGFEPSSYRDNGWGLFAGLVPPTP